MLRASVSPATTSEPPGAGDHAGMLAELERYRSLVEHSLTAMAIYRDGVVIFANPAAAELFGAADCDDVIGLRAQDMIPERAAASFHDRMRRVMAGERVRGERQRVRRFDGSERWVESDSMLVDYDGRPAVQVQSRDVTGRVEAEEALVVSERRERLIARQLEAIVQNNVASVYVKDLSGRYLLVNRSWSEATGAHREQALGRTDAELFADAYEPSWREHDQQAALGVVRREEHFAGEGGSRWFDTVKFPLHDADGNVYAICGLSPDITEHKQAHALLRDHAEELARSNHDLEQFTSVASHDLAEPLRTISGFSRLLSQRYAGRLDAKADEYLAFIAGGVERMGALLDGLLAYSRAGREEEQADVALPDLVDEVLAALDAAITASGAHMTVGELPSLHGNRVQLRQIVQNLVGNALKFAAAADRPPRIAVTAEREPGGWRVLVADNGIGVDPTLAPRIFEAFGRLHSRAEYEGTGIGLAIVRRLVERRGGRITVEPREGGGSVFAFTVPDTPPGT